MYFVTCTVYIAFKCMTCTFAGPTLNIRAVSSTPTTISLTWTAADDRLYYYSAGISYIVFYFMNNITYAMNTETESITITGLKPDTEYTFFVEAGINADFVIGPKGNLTYHTQTDGE